MKDPAECSQLRKYAPPQLVFLGSVKSITRGGGSGAFKDGNSGMSMVMMSDRGAKENIAEVGRDPRGFGLYLFDYAPKFRSAHGSGRQFGVMADEVERVMPAAVIVAADGYRRVDYSLLGLSRTPNL
jgi:hypothetical protein